MRLQKKSRSQRLQIESIQNPEVKSNNLDDKCSQVGLKSNIVENDNFMFQVGGNKVLVPINSNSHVERAQEKDEKLKSSKDISCSSTLEFNHPTSRKSLDQEN